MQSQTHPVDEARHLLQNDDNHPHSTAAASDTRTLIIACAITTFFFLVELAGGYLAGSLAIMSDAAHLLSDLAGFAISLVAVSVARLPANEHLSFGFARAEVLGALVSILFIWALTIVLIFFAFHRILNPSPVNGPLMLFLGIIGLVVNLCLGLVLGHDHSHSHGHQHQHSHAHHGYNDIESHGHHHNHEHDHDHSPFSWSAIKDMLAGDDTRSVNIRAAYLHVLGDALQNVGVIFAAIIITFNPKWSFIDPICTLFFAVIVIMTTAGLAKETVGVLMEAAPSFLNLAEINNGLEQISGVYKVGDLHVWSITPRIPALSVHLYRNPDACSHDILRKAQDMLDSRYSISHATIQVNCDTPGCCDNTLLGTESGSNCVKAEQLRQSNPAV